MACVYLSKYAEQCLIRQNMELLAEKNEIEAEIRTLEAKHYNAMTVKCYFDHTYSSVLANEADYDMLVKTGQTIFTAEENTKKIHTALCDARRRLFRVMISLAPIESSVKSIKSIVHFTAIE